MSRIAYRFSVSEEYHKDVIDFLNEFPRTTRGKIIIEAVRDFSRKFESSGQPRREQSGRALDIGKMLGKPGNNKEV